MSVRCREEAESTFGDHFEALADIVTESVRFYYEFYGERAYTHESWTRCSIIRDEIKERLTAYAEASKGFEVLRDGNATFFGVLSKFTVRVKKLSDNLHANTGKTQYSFDFDHQVPVQVELFGDELELTHLYLGYVATENDPLNPPIYLVCNSEGGGIEWSIHLNPTAPSPPATLEPLAPAAPAPDTEPRRVRMKKEATERKAGNE
jgi:hypothetical protein